MRRRHRHRHSLRSHGTPLALEDPFDPCAASWAHNLLVGTRLRHLSPADVRHIDHVGLLCALPERLPAPAEPVFDEGGYPDPAQLRKALRRYVRVHPALQRPPAPTEPVAGNLRTLGRLFGLGRRGLEVLTFLLAARHSPPVTELVDTFTDLTPGHRNAGLVATALNAPITEVRRLLSRQGLLRTGLVVDDGPDKLPTPRDDLFDLTTVPGLGRDAVLGHFLPEAPRPTLARRDYRHLDAQVRLLERLLGQGLAARSPGLNVLLHGPTGTGKTELARLVARRLGVKLFVAGLTDESGDAPTVRERLASLMAGQRLLGQAGALLLFDELEDVFRAQGLVHTAEHLSKQWLNDLLEQNPVPTLWITNDSHAVDPAFLRRFAYSIEFPALCAGQREAVLNRHLGRGHAARRSADRGPADASHADPGPGLSAPEVRQLAERFEASPGQLAGAVRWSRVAGGGSVTRPDVEQLLSPSQKLLTGVDPLQQPPVFDPAGYRLEAVAASTDLAALADRLAAWKPGGRLGVSLVLYGPPGTGKSEYVRYLAGRMGRRLVERRASDLQSMYVGGTEKLIAAAFREAEQEGAVLLLDEVDTFLRSRDKAVRAWEVSMTNELLQQLERFRGVVACTTNLWEDLDAAALRRFVFKVELGYLGPEQAFALLCQLHGRKVPAREAPRIRAALAALTRLTPGDFAAVRRRVRALGSRLTAGQLVEELAAEVRVKGESGRRIGF